MLAIKSLMKEHRLIERMIRILERKIDEMRISNQIDMNFIDDLFNFIRKYANNTHRRKEEDILFKDLEKKPLSPNHIKMMRELLEDHIYERTIVSKLNEVYLQIIRDNIDLRENLINLLIDLVDFYHKHIQKEDNEFFIPIISYYTDEEQSKMFQTFEEFDEPLIHQKYKKIIETLEN